MKKIFFIITILMCLSFNQLVFAAENTTINKQYKKNVKLKTKETETISGEIFTLGAEETVKLISIDEALELAINKNLELFQSQKDLTIAENNIKIANRLQNPQIQATMLIGKSNIGSPQQFGLNSPLEIRKRGLRKQLAKSEKKWAETDFENKLFQIKMDVRLAYVNLAAAKSYVKITKQQQDILKAIVDKANDCVGTGTVPQSELLQAELYLERWDTILNSTINQLKKARYDFNRTLGLDGSEAIVYDILDDELPGIEQVDLIKLNTPSPKSNFKEITEIGKIAFENRKDVRLAKQEIDIAKKNLRVAAGQRIPDVELAGGMSITPPRLNNSENSGALYGGYFGLNVDVPMLHTYTPEIKNARLELEKKEANYKLVQNLAKQDVKSAYSDFELARVNLNCYNDKLIKKSKEVLSQAQYSYKIGETNLSSLILAEHFHLEFMSNYIDALSFYYISWIEVLRASNVEEI